MNMNTNEILVSMARYIHAVYDIEIDANDPNLNIKTKKYVKKLGENDETLSSYWDSYISNLTGKVDVKKTNAEAALERHGAETTTSTYRGVETRVNHKSKSRSNNKTAILYRGQSL